ncbi:hypothetical protein F5Y10DRAFT_231735 [Nemania abortiva]|nr:hypothetical protein F5Y10DRAFT_231735 [Nemania abortiva]
MRRTPFTLVFTTKFAMDWGKKSGNKPDLFANEADFYRGRPLFEVGQRCKLWINYQAGSEGRKGTERQDTLDLDLMEGTLTEETSDWLKNDSPKNGYCILFIPRAVGPYFQPAYFTSVPISDANWKVILDLFFVPKFYKEKVDRNLPSVISVARSLQEVGDQEPQELQMSIGTTAVTATQGFAFASTYFKSRRFTSAIIVGCADDRIKEVEDLGFQAWRQQSLLMLGIFAEIQLKRLEALVDERKTEQDALKESLDDESKSSKEQKFGWLLVERVLGLRDNLQSAQQELETIKLQLDHVRKRHAPDPEPNGNSETVNADGNDEEEKTYRENTSEFTQLFSDRLHDISNRLNGLSAECKLSTDSISYWTELIRNELTREEAHRAAKNTKIGTFVGSVALAYLPLTAVATIMAMPIFGWANDWKNLRFHSVRANNQSNGTAAGSGPARAVGIGLPVVSGYLWIYISLAFTLFIFTTTPFAYVVTDGNLWSLVEWLTQKLTLGGLLVGRSIGGLAPFETFKKALGGALTYFKKSIKWSIIGQALLTAFNKVLEKVLAYFKMLIAWLKTLKPRLRAVRDSTNRAFGVVSDRVSSLVPLAPLGTSNSPSPSV